MANDARPRHRAPTNSENVARLVDILVNKLDARYRGRQDVLRPTVEILSASNGAALRGRRLVQRVVALIRQIVLRTPSAASWPIAYRRREHLR
jgi:hypothetical protein